ncbi:hypothetical protein BH23VER1_BH23VER1_00730 [soil metagenome]
MVEDAVGLVTPLAPEDAARVDGQGQDVARLEPLADEALDEAVELGILEHAVDLGAEFGAQAAFAGEVEEGVVGKRVPEEV